MKHFFATSIILVTLQMSVPNFNLLDNNSLEWVKIYESNLNKKQIVVNFNRTGNLILDFENESEVHFILTDVDTDYKGLGYKKMQTPFYVSQFKINAFVIVQFKGNKYRVTVKDIKLTPIKDFSEVGIPLGSVRQIEDYAINKKGYTGVFSKTSAKIYSYTFDSLFKPVDYTNTEW
jgi:hypothetical protein